jgi:Tfp pilus assembly protein PilF
VQLAKLFENTGQVAEADNQYNITLDERPGYAYALAGIGRLLLHENKTDEAIQYFQQADAQVDDIVFKELMTEALLQKGDIKQAAVLNAAILKALNDHQHSSTKEDKGHHHAGMELAYANMLAGNYEEALSNAMAEYKRRPQNIDVNECVAWAYYKKGEAVKAFPFIKTALSTNSVHPRLLCRAALIFNKNDRKHEAAILASAAINKNPVVEKELKQEATQLLAELK